MRIFLIAAISLLVLGSVLFQSFGESTYFSSYVANLVFHNNLHEVVPGRFFRSGEMSRKDLGEVIDRYQIKSVIDLRLDEDAADASGVTESAAATAHGAAYRHVPFSSARADQRESLEKLLRSYDELPAPVLVHCSSGTHRTGVASAVWLLEKERRPAGEALGQLSLKYGFVQTERAIKTYFQGKPTLDKIIVEFAAANTQSGVSFRDWMQKTKLLDRP